MAFQHALQPAGGVFRDGMKLVVPRIGGGDAGAELPPVCVKCGLPSGRPLKRNFFWHEPWLYALILLGVLVYAILAMVMRKKMVLNVPLCDAHWSRRRNLILTAWLVVLAGIAAPFIFSAAGIDVAPGVILMILLILGGAILGALVSNPIRPARIDDRSGVFSGCGEIFLQQLPAEAPLAPTPVVMPVQPAGAVPPPPPPR